MVGHDRRDLSAQAAHLAAQARQLPGRVEHGEHAIAPRLGGGIECPVRAADAPCGPQAAALRHDLEAQRRAAAARFHDDTAGAADPVAGPLVAAAAIARVFSQHAQPHVAERFLNESIGAAPADLLVDHRAVGGNAAVERAGVAHVPPARGIAIGAPLCVAGDGAAGEDVAVPIVARHVGVTVPAT